MSDTAIEEKIRKIRQDLYNFNLSEPSSLDLYLQENRDLKLAELDSPFKFASSTLKSCGLKNSQSAEELNNLDDVYESPIFMQHPDSSSNYYKAQRETTKADEFERSAKGIEQKLVDLQDEYKKIIKDKDQELGKMAERLRNVEYEARIKGKGEKNVEELKQSTRELVLKAESLGVERDFLLQENSGLKQKWLVSEEECRKLKDAFGNLESENQRLRLKAGKHRRKIEELRKENEMLFKTVNSSKLPRLSYSGLSSCSPKGPSSRSTRKPSSNEMPKKNSLFDSETTERKRRSPSLPRKSSKRPLPRCRSTSGPRADPFSAHFSKLFKDLSTLFAVSSPSQLTSAAKSLISENKALQLTKDAFSKLQKIVVSNSPPSTFSTAPGGNTCVNWFKRLIKEYLELTCCGLDSAVRRTRTFPGPFRRYSWRTRAC
jgi:hypothetical protein